jgi:replication-associated recombination protein RarA
MENFIFPRQLEQQLKDFIEYPESIPNILCFYGIPAQGKTSFAKFLAKQVANEFAYFDANSHLLENHDASYVAKSIAAMNRTFSFNWDAGREFDKCYIIDEWHNYSAQRQDSYKILFDEIIDVDKRRDTRSLVIICLNTDDKKTIKKILSPAIYSRCHTIGFDIPVSDVEDIIERALKYFPELESEVIRKSIPDWRAITRASQMLKRRIAM